MSVEDKDVQAYLARIRKTIADSRNMVSQAELRIAETDRMLERQGLTRAQVMAMRFSDAQMEAVNAELRRRGMDPLDDFLKGDYEAPPAEGQKDGEEPGEGPEAGDTTAPELENRQRKFGMMMKPFQL